MIFLERVHSESLVSSVLGGKVLAKDLCNKGVNQPMRHMRVAICLRDPASLIAILGALDGQVASVLLLSDALGPQDVQAIVEREACETIVTDREDLTAEPKVCGPADIFGEWREPEPVETVWLMTTSGTTGVPKTVPHTLKSLSRSVLASRQGSLPVWGMLYDPTRFAGMQVLLQALIGRGVLALVDRSAPLADQLAFLVESGVTHLSATPTLWRRILMWPGHTGLPLQQVTLGGEIVDQQILSSLSAAFPAARISHIYASTEAGVGFSVTDGKAGFPEDYLRAAPNGIELSIREGILWVRNPAGSAQNAAQILSQDDAGFIRTGDQVVQENGRILFLGRDSGLINVGGIKINPERVEAVIASVPGVSLVKVFSLPSPIMGALVIADVAPYPGTEQGPLKDAILAACRASLERAAIPARIRFVEDIKLNAAGKITRNVDGGSVR